MTEADFANLSLIGSHAPLRRLLERATVVSSDDVPAEIVTMNTQVVLAGDGTSDRRIVRVVYPQDADATRGLISVLDPLGTALLGASPGQVIEYSIPGGRACLRVEKLIYQPERSLRTQLVTKSVPAVES